MRLNNIINQTAMQNVYQSSDKARLIITPIIGISRDPNSKMIVVGLRFALCYKVSNQLVEPSGLAFV